MTDFISHKREPLVFSYANCIPTDFRHGVRSVHLTSATAPSVRENLSPSDVGIVGPTDIVLVFEDTKRFSDCPVDVQVASHVESEYTGDPLPDYLEGSAIIHLSRAQAWALVARLMSQLSFEGAKHGLEDPEQILACRDSTLGHIAFMHLLQGASCDDPEVRSMLIQDGLIPAETDGERLGSALPPSIRQ